MLKIIKRISLVFLLGLFVFIPGLVLAIDLGTVMVDETRQKAGYALATETTFAETVGIVIAIALSFVGVIFLLLMVYAGYLWMTARGQDEQIEKAKKIIIASVIGLIITVAAYSITAYVVPAILIKAAS